MEKLLEQEAMMEENQKVRVLGVRGFFWVRRRRRVKPIGRLPPHHPDSPEDQLGLRLQGDYPPCPLLSHITSTHSQRFHPLQLAHTCKSPRP